ncbi:hypothetical protein [Spirosoma sp. KUDC1026]|uniref:hypothetical protein n=1 Tax=Spirosoma sp. KUDC1026 TaxID=2745947 RepID=UPI00159BE3AC|nr:hypothetical protein [Spirosoma sp. KUDC1026]QKZ15178.1 hypothetical protein HU175_22155 [Spirosoma sp. KUDC1026]
MRLVTLIVGSVLVLGMLTLGWFLIQANRENTTLRESLNVALSAISSLKLDIADMKQKQAEQNEKVARADADREKRDAETRATVGAMSAIAQQMLAVRGLVENRLLAPERLADTSKGGLRVDSAFVAAVAGQGVLLEQRTTDLRDANQTIQNKDGQISDLEKVINRTGKGIADARAETQDRVAELSNGIIRKLTNSGKIRENRAADKRLMGLQDSLTVTNP